MQDRLIQIEEKIGFIEHQQQAFDEAINELLNRIVAIEKSIGRMQANLDDRLNQMSTDMQAFGDQDGEDDEEPPPPHWGRVPGREP